MNANDGEEEDSDALDGTVAAQETILIALANSKPTTKCRYGLLVDEKPREHSGKFRPEFSRSEPMPVGVDSEKVEE